MQSSISRRFDGERILLTGSTGFLAKSLLERILTNLPGVARIHLMVRPRNGLSLDERVAQDVFSSDVFDGLRAAWGDRFEAKLAEKVSVVGGDLAEDHFGMSEDAYGRLASDVTLVLNCAAACSFLEPLDRSLQANALGAGRVLKFAADAGNAPMVHLSTCYVGATLHSLVGEEPLPVGHTPASMGNGSGPVFELDAEVQSLLDACSRAREGVGAGEGDDACVALGRQQAQRRGWNDIYQYTKALGEQYLSRDHGGVPISIVRPSIIESTYNAPFPGWIDGVRMADPIIVEYGRGNFLRFVGSTETVLDLVPCDMVSNLILASVPPREPVDAPAVYQIASSTWNPVTMGDLIEDAYQAFTQLAAKHPSQLSAPARRGEMVSEAQFRKELAGKRRWLRWARRAQQLFGLKRAARRSARLLKIVNKAELLTDLYAFYACTSPRFDVTRTRTLLEGLAPEDRSAFSFDLSQLDWRDYMRKRHIPGLLRLSGFDETRS